MSGAAQPAGDDPRTGSAAELHRGPRHARSHRRRGPSYRATGVAFVLYALLAIPAYWPIWPGDPGRLTDACSCQDSLQQAWFLTWFPSALIHGHNPFITTYIEFPHGANMAVNTMMPLLGLLSVPLTAAAGAVSSVNLWLFLAFPLSATACFVLIRRWVRWTPAALVGGLLYGFSPYAVGQGAGHLDLVFVPLPPLLLLLLDELYARQRRNPVLTGVVLGLVAAAQYLVAAEVFASSLVVAVIGTVIVAIARWRLLRQRVLHVLIGLGAAAVICGALIAYPLWIQMTGPDRFAGSAHGTYPFPADLAATVVPSLHQLLAPSSALAISNHFDVGFLIENGDYLGIPLLVVLIALVVWRWRLAIVRFCAAMLLVAELLALGPTLTVDTHNTGFPLPDRLFDHLPFFTSFLDARFSLYVDLFAAVLLAVGAEQLYASLRRIPRLRPVIVLAVVAVALFPLIPAWPYQSTSERSPALFTDPALTQRIPTDSVALTYPYPTSTDASAMLWQAASGIRFRLLGGYALEPGPTGGASFNPYPPYLDAVPATLIADEFGRTLDDQLPGAAAVTPAQVRSFLTHYQVATVVVDPVGVDPQKALRLLRAALGTPPERVGQLDVWFGADGLLQTSSG